MEKAKSFKRHQSKVIMSFIQVSPKSSVVVGSKFGPKEVIVYCMPSLNDCMAILPRHLGNYILSFTYAWLEFYLDNLVEKYGHSFVNKALSYLPVKGKAGKKKVELYKMIVLHIKTRHIDGKDVDTKIQDALVVRHQSIEREREHKQLITLNKQFNIQRLNVGDIFVGGRDFCKRLYLVIQKSLKTYYCLMVEIENETETHYTLKFTGSWVIWRGGRIAESIETNMPILEVEEPIKPRKQLILRSQRYNQYTEAEFNDKTRRFYFTKLFGDA